MEKKFVLLEVVYLTSIVFPKYNYSLSTPLLESVISVRKCLFRRVQPLGGDSIYFAERKFVLLEAVCLATAASPLHVLTSGVYT